MRVQTFSIVVGTRACDAKCPFCISRMTGFDVLPPRGEINVVNFRSACELARVGGTTTVLFTGKGEPTLYPDELTEYLQLLKPYSFPIKELQTNALEIGRLAQNKRAHTLTVDTLVGWHALGLNTIAISVVGVTPQFNQAVYNQDYPDLARTVGFVHALGFTVRLCVMMHQGAVDSPARVDEVIEFCRLNGVEQLTIRSITAPAPGLSHNDDAYAWTVERGLSPEQVAAIVAHCRARGTKIMTLEHGAEVYDISGQNLCLSDCLTFEPDSSRIRTLIFYSDGRITHTWQHEGATLLGGHRPVIVDHQSFLDWRKRRLP